MTKRLLGGKIRRVDDGYVKKYLPSEYHLVKDAYKHIAHIKQVPKMVFTDDSFEIFTSCIHDAQTLLDWYPLRNFDKRVYYATEMISFLKALNDAGYAHRDLNPKNVLVTPASLHVIDWDYVCPNVVAFKDAYDITGRGLPDPNRTNHIHVFRSFFIVDLPPDIIKTLTSFDYYKRLGIIPSVAEMLGIERVGGGSGTPSHRTVCCTSSKYNAICALESDGTSVLTCKFLVGTQEE